ncbi:MAG: heavy metal translocating P-type ATPase [Bacillota bacterium]|nr:heavy metal translocating P-type ATPase [Bacillota bacterium]
MILTVFLSGLLFLTGLALEFAGSFSPAISGAFFIAAYLLSGYEVLEKALKNIFHGRIFDENFLMSVATVGAFAIGKFSEGAAVMLLFQIGEFFQERAVLRSRESIAGLMDMRPDYANLIKDGAEKRVKPEEAAVNDIIIVKPFEKVPLDGVIVDGETSLDASALTGESLPVAVMPGDEITSGSINQTGTISVRVKSVYSDSTVYKIMALVENAQSAKSKTENFISAFAEIYTPVVVALAAALAVLPPLLLPGAQFKVWLYRALIFLVVSCPCAIVISVPLGFFAGLGCASKNGILIKGSGFLQALTKLDTVVFDKTGTLTKGMFKVAAIEPSGGFSKEEVLTAAAYAESSSYHPIGRSILDAYGRDTDKSRIESCSEIPGFGVYIRLDGKEVLAGNDRWLGKHGVDNIERRDGAAVYVAIDGRFAGAISIKDELKDDARQAVADIKGLGIKNVALLTGDKKSAAAAAAGELNIDERDVYFELLPDEKVKIVEKLQSALPKDKKLAFVGDGINDAPVLARSDVGVSMGKVSSDAAMEASDIVLMYDRPSDLAKAVKIAKRVNRLVRQNIVFALAVKAAVLLLSALGIAAMWAAIFADVGVALLAVLNSLRAFSVKK